MDWLQRAEEVAKLLQQFPDNHEYTAVAGEDDSIVETGSVKEESTRLPRRTKTEAIQKMAIQEKDDDAELLDVVIIHPSIHPSIQILIHSYSFTFR